MKTKEMLQFMQGEGYPISLVARQSGVDYYRLFRHVRNGKGITDDEKATVWRFCLCQPVLQEVMHKMAEEVDIYRETNMCLCTFTQRAAGSGCHVCSGEE